MKKSIKVVLIILVFITISIMGIIIYAYLNEKSEIKQLPPYYLDLAEQCSSGYSYGCCMASVWTMKYGGYKLSKHGFCDDGFKLGMLKCPESFKWCQPVAD